MEKKNKKKTFGFMGREKSECGMRREEHKKNKGVEYGEVN